MPLPRPVGLTLPTLQQLAHGGDRGAAQDWLAPTVAADSTQRGRPAGRPSIGRLRDYSARAVSTAWCLLSRPRPAIAGESTSISCVPIFVHSAASSSGDPAASYSACKPTPRRSASWPYKPMTLTGPSPPHPVAMGSTVTRSCLLTRPRLLARLSQSRADPPSFLTVSAPDPWGVRSPLDSSCRLPFHEAACAHAGFATTPSDSASREGARCVAPTLPFAIGG
jgi:hypothetical protein